MNHAPRLAARGGRLNNFDLIRLVAALQVMLFHGLDNLRLEIPRWSEPLAWFPGVPIFFVLSGFLVSMSWERNPDLRSYAINRLMRIYPALWVCFLISVTSVACIRPDLLVASNPTELVAWFVAQTTFGQVFNPSFLRHYGVGALNGSLWTIPVELQFYAIVPITYLGLRLQKRSSTTLIPLILVCLLVNRSFAAWKLSSDSLMMKLFGTTFLPHVWYFLAGVLVQREFSKLAPLFAGKFIYWLTAHVMCCSLLGSLGFNVSGNLIGPLPSLTLIGVTFSAGYTLPYLSERLLRGNDISYGSYLYHMVIINALLELHWPATTATLLAVFGITMLCAIASYKLVEKPALGFKYLFNREAGKVAEAPLTAAATRSN